MKVYKFGGASIRSAKAVMNMCNIIQSSADRKLLIVVSAMGKTTNALEKILELKRTGKPYKNDLIKLKQDHQLILNELFTEKHAVEEKVEILFEELEEKLNHEYGFSAHYDQVVPYGELLSSTIVQAYLSINIANSVWLDARNYITTDDTFREGKVDWDITFENIRNEIPGVLAQNIIITQGFIGGFQNLTTTLGREGSDFSAAIFASGLQADSVTIWKDVPGILSGDPAQFDDVSQFNALSYQEAAEMTFYGASVIHPKTIKPLANRNIPLFVKSFDDPKGAGTIIHNDNMEHLPPTIIIKERQSLLTLTIKDFSFINEESLKIIFHELSVLNIKINMMQNSAISFMICIDHDENKIQQLQDKLKEQFTFAIQENLRLLTIKNYTDNFLKKYVPKDTVLEQRTLRNFQSLITS